MKRLFYIICAMGIIVSICSCEETKDYEDLMSNTDDYTSETGGDYYQGEGIDVSMYNQARIFPGLVDTLKEKHLEEASIELDLSYQYIDANNLGLKKVPSPIYSSGLYAGAGEKITIQLDEDIKGLSVQIGIHQRNLGVLVDQGTYVERAPLVVTSSPLFKGRNEIRNPFGGYIWIRRSGNDGQNLGKISLKVEGAYKAPDYIEGVTQASEWISEIKATTVPWVELRGKHVAFSVPVDYIKQKANASFVENADKALRLWDEWIECMYEFYGLDDVDKDFPMPDYPVRAVMDVHLITERYSFYGTYSGTENNDVIELLKTEENIDMLISPEGIVTGADNICNFIAWVQRNWLEQPNNSTVWNKAPSNFDWIYTMMPNFYFLYKDHWAKNNNILQQYQTQGGTNKNMATKANSIILQKENFDKLVQFASIGDTCRLFNPNATTVVKMEEDGNAGTRYPVLAFFTQIMGYRQGEKDGWKFFGYFNRYIQKRENPGYYSENGLDKLLYALTDYYDRDFTALYDRWGLEISDEARLYALTQSASHMEKKVWMYNAMTENEGNIEPFDGKVFYTKSGETPFRHDRKGWNAAAYGKGTGYVDEGDLPEELIDGLWTARNYKSDKVLPSNLLDGDRGTLWESYSDHYVQYTDKDGVVHYPYKIDFLYKNAKTPEYDYYVVFGTDVPLEKVSGIYIANGNTNGSKSLYESKDDPGWNYAPKHIIVEFTKDELIFDGESYINAVGTGAVSWETVYDSDGSDAEKQQFHPDRNNLFYIDLDREHTGVRGVRLRLDKDTHRAKDKPADWNEEEKPNRPEINRYLDRIHKFAEFGTFYYNN